MARLGEKDSSGGSKENKFPHIYWIYGLLLVIILFFLYMSGPSEKETSWNEFETQMLIQGDVEKLVVLNNEQVEVYIKKDSLSKPFHSEDLGKRNFLNASQAHYFFTIGSVDVFHEQMKEVQAKQPELNEIPITYETRQNWWSIALTWALPILLLVFVWRFILNRYSNRESGFGTAYSFGRSKARIQQKGSKNRVTFDDVAGLKEAKEEIYEMVKFLKDPERYRKLGAKIPKGILLIGPPGTGKTLLAKAVAGEADVPFLSLSGSEFIEMFVGVGAARMRDLFSKAKELAPSIIFIDEIDTIGRTRGKAHAFQSNDERESTLNQLLAELDGFDTSSGVILLAATNRADILDPALLRSGRFDRHIHLDLPSLTEREAIFKVHMKPLILDNNVDVHLLASLTPGFSGADIANMCNEAALIAARNEKEAVGKEDFIQAVDRTIGGLEKRSKIISPEEKKRIAIHEAGHVIASSYLKHAHPVMKVSIIPRGKSLGSAWYLPEEHQLIIKEEFVDHMCAALGGRAAEELMFGNTSSNAIDDLERVSKQAYNMVMYYGMGESIPNLSYYDSTGRIEQSLYKPYSENTAEKIDEEVLDVVNEAYKRTSKILNEHRSELEELAKKLIEKEVLYKEEIEQILGVRNNKNIKTNINEIV